jgi:hypothetical protein
MRQRVQEIKTLMQDVGARNTDTAHDMLQIEIVTH